MWRSKNTTKTGVVFNLENSSYTNGGINMFFGIEPVDLNNNASGENTHTNSRGGISIHINTVNNVHFEVHKTNTDTGYKHFFADGGNSPTITGTGGVSFNTQTHPTWGTNSGTIAFTHGI